MSPPNRLSGGIYGEFRAALESALSSLSSSLGLGPLPKLLKALEEFLIEEESVRKVVQRSRKRVAKPFTTNVRIPNLECRRTSLLRTTNLNLAGINPAGEGVSHLVKQRDGSHTSGQ